MGTVIAAANWPEVNPDGVDAELFAMTLITGTEQNLIKISTPESL